MLLKSALLALSFFLMPMSMADAAPKAKANAAGKARVVKGKAAPSIRGTKAGTNRAADMKGGTETNARTCDPPCDKNQYCLRGQCIDET